MNKIHLFEGWESPEYFFRPAVRSLLVNHILINIDIRTAAEVEEDAAEEDSDEEVGDDSFFCLCKRQPPDAVDKEESKSLKRKVSQRQVQQQQHQVVPQRKSKSQWEKLTTVENLQRTSKITDVLGDVKEAFDNKVTPFFALFICCWGTVFLELWKRQRATLAYEWDVDQFEANEPDRPQFYGTSVKPDPVTLDVMWFYPFKRQLMKYTTSVSILLLMVALVIASVVGVIIYRVIMNVDYCPNLNDNECLVLTTVVSSILNAVSILLLGKVYDMLAIKLTDWENHRTQTRYDDALIMKLFAFQFVNSYASCFYIAFFRGRGSIFKDRYVDDCEGSCMTQLSFQVLILMVAKPFPKFLKDICIPLLLRLWRQRPNCLRCLCLPCCKPTNQVGQGDNQASEEDPEDKVPPPHASHVGFLERERLKPDLGDFTLGEFTEKVILYGFLMVSRG
ncbi:anoctamin [Elysia marginata]|uniref:Anoctamin n=1 Tax=Elysia marginata TaxID=1093978 RepID=A0AAV4IJ10_9GAST|nr:anoctamin [Elysia marginata]